MSQESPSAGRTVRVADVLDHGRFTGLPLLVATFTVLALVFDGFDIQAVGFVTPALLQQWSMTKAEFWAAPAAGLVGMAVGGMLIGPLGDRVGRRRALIVSMVVVAIGSFVSAYAASYHELTFWRLVTGIGLGGSLPNAAALMVEFSPLARRHLSLSVTIIGVPIGGVIGAEAASHLLPAFGWPSVFIAGAVLPAALALAMWVALPESPRFLARHPEKHAELLRLMQRLAPERNFGADDRFVVDEPQAEGERQGVLVLLSAPFRRDTLLLWFAWLANSFCVYAFFNWLAAVLAGVGWPTTQALQGVRAFNLGGVAIVFVLAACLTRFGSRAVLPAFAVLGAASMAALAVMPGAFAPGAPAWVPMTLMAAAGAMILGLQTGLYSLSAHIYPTPCRASGIGSAMAVGRIGGILSSFAGVLLAMIGEGVGTFFGGIALVILTAGVAILVIGRHVPSLRAEAARMRAEAQPRVSSATKS